MTTVQRRHTFEHRINNAFAWGLRHWLLVANCVVLLYGGLPWLSPLLRAAGFDTLGSAIFLAYRPLCHQLPERSFFVFGYQVAFCHREAAMYTLLFLGGLLFALVRDRLRPLPFAVGGLLLLPMLLDGGSHLVDDMLHLGLRGGGDAPGTLNFWLRMVTGFLFAVAMILVVYPRLEREFESGLVTQTS
jgi:uncharacterized membrane protein